MKKVNTILFDLDGTLIDSNEIIIASYRHAYETHLPALDITRQTIIDNIGPTLETIFSRYADDVTMIPKLIATYRAYYTAHEAETHRIYPRVMEVLTQLKWADYQLGIVTSKTRDAAWPSIRHYGLDRLFDVIITLDDVSQPKPDKEAVLKALAYFDRVTGAMMIGDNPSDVLAGINAGIIAAGVGWSIKGATALWEAGADYVFPDMDTFLEILTKLNQEAVNVYEQENGLFIL